MREVRLALLEADVNYGVAKKFVADVTQKCIGAGVLESLTPAQQVIKIVNDELTELMGSTHQRINLSSRIPTVLLMCGLQGSGKTTHSAKLAYMFRQQGKRPLLVACDIYRPAAIEQLKVVGEKAGVPVFEMGQTDPVKIVKKALSHAHDYGNDIVIIDTAGRLHIDEALMDELKAVKEAAKPENSSLLPPMLALMFSGAAMAEDNGLGVRKLLVSEARAFVHNGIASGAFAGKSVQDYRTEGWVAPLFESVSMGRKEIRNVSTPVRQGKDWIVPFVLRDHGNGNSYAVRARVSDAGGSPRVVAVENLRQLFVILGKEAQALGS